MIENIENILKGLTPITLEEMKDIRLMDRIDSKFVAPVALLPQLLKEMEPFFMVQTKNDTRVAPYTTQYFDTPDLEMFVMHQNGKLNRQKIRIRSYADSDLSFLEIKNKNNKGRTSKKRIEVNQPAVRSIKEFQEEMDFLTEHSIFSAGSLIPSLSNNFHRITCVNNRKTERITIDINLSFLNERTGGETSFDDLMILELKQDGWQRSDFRDILLNLRIKKNSFSKYCMGVVLTDPSVKYNRFKNRLAKINKLR
ncbi:polyphosphate polymerase domain-containing protein [Bacteroidales bacterium OttesenSCG-928-A17]|nr:polyphosphate polymerase domain-containing protein [Bacteroidales bacterium OttesenSCG-928-A17]